MKKYHLLTLEEKKSFPDWIKVKSWSLDVNTQLLDEKIHKRVVASQ